MSNESVFEIDFAGGELERLLLKGLTAEGRLPPNGNYTTSLRVQGPGVDQQLADKLKTMKLVVNVTRNGPAWA